MFPGLVSELVPGLVPGLVPRLVPYSGIIEYDPAFPRLPGVYLISSSWISRLRSTKNCVFCSWHKFIKVEFGTVKSSRHAAVFAQSKRAKYKSICEWVKVFSLRQIQNPLICLR